jgi:hypothetical protein
LQFAARTAVGMAAASLLLVGASPARSLVWHSYGGGPSPWCALVIEINTKDGYMKHKHYASVATAAQIKAIVTAALAGKADLLRVTPPEIRKAQADELTFFAHWKANRFSNSTAMTPYTPKEAARVLAYQRTHCGITGP